eukprot:1159703-Pelagomonas_calceolata.AAC.2
MCLTLLNGRFCWVCLIKETLSELGQLSGSVQSSLCWHTPMDAREECQGFLKVPFNERLDVPCVSTFTVFILTSDPLGVYESEECKLCSA